MKLIYTLNMLSLFALPVLAELDTSTCLNKNEETNCCVGENACSNSGTNGSAVVGKGSCVGENYVCQGIGRYEGATGSVGDGSCVGEYTCRNAGSYGTFAVAESACIGERSCINAGRDTGSTFKAGTASCVGGVDENKSCFQAAWKGDVEIGDRSCKGKDACNQLGYNGTVKVGNDTCIGFQACFQTGNQGGEVEIGDGSCQASYSCRAIGQLAVEPFTREQGKLEIGNGSCNCEGCCGCLKAGDKVPDGMCNELGDGPEACCMEQGDRNPFGPLKVSNLCEEEEDVCLKATVSGDPHITTFSQLKYDCMGQGEFILAKSQSEDDPLEIRGLFVDPQFSGEDDPWESDRSAQTVTRGVAFVVDEDVPMIRITTDQELEAESCSLYFHVDGVGDVTFDQMLNDPELLKRRDVAVSRFDRDYENIEFKFGDYDATIYVHTKPSSSEKWGCVMMVSSCLKPKHHRDVLGLFGTNNPYRDDDWTTPDGTKLPIPTNPKDGKGRALSTDFCLNNWCYEGPESNPSENSFFGHELHTYYSRCDKNPYEDDYDQEKFDALRAKLRVSCDEAEVFNIPSEVLYDAALANHLENHDDVDDCPVGAIEEAMNNTLIAKANCWVAPTSPPSQAPTSSFPDIPEPPSVVPSSNTRTSEIHGDPHFKTWLGEHFEYHGQCDLVMLKDSSFADGLGLQIQIRTKLVRYWSYIHSVAINIGGDILEIEGSAAFIDSDELFYWHNLERKGNMKTLGGFPVSAHRMSKKTQVFVIDLSSKYPGQSIEIKTFKEFVKVEYKNGSEESIGNSVGMMGDFMTGKTLGRDGDIVFDDFMEYGSEWQVRPSDHMLFHDVSQPQFPKSCVVPEQPRGQIRRRLDGSSIKEADAEKACASLMDPLDRKDCVYDVLATQDLEMVGAF